MSVFSPYEMIPIPMAVRVALEQTSALRSEKVSIVQAVNRVLAQKVIAPDSVPPFPASIKDGYAVVSSDGPGVYDVIGESRAGYLDPIEVKKGTVAYITTGAPVPPGADAVLQIEDTEVALREGNRISKVHIKKSVPSGYDIRPIGSDILVGSTVLDPGTLIGEAEVGILATVGVISVAVHRRPLVAVLSTGDEVVDPDSKPAPGQIRDANRALLLAALSKAGADTLDLGIAKDTEGHLEACLARALAADVDVFITSGGVSMGDRDLVKPLLERNGVVHYGRVLMKPGKPLTFATLSKLEKVDREKESERTRDKEEEKEKMEEKKQKMLFFGLPGNPVSSFVCFHLVVLPVLRKMAGWNHPELRRIHVRIQNDIKMDPERPEYHRVQIAWASTSETRSETHHASQLRAPLDLITSWTPSKANDAVKFEFHAFSTGNQISSRLLSARTANGLLEVPQASGILKRGSVVPALLIDGLQSMMTSEC
uniref:Molybdopterin biosynthesis protein CNX1 n=1 Tax=Polytomella parva TaxID=51329 RepID=A0A7S0UQY7_9CHLO|mmetsp:Transcript_18236/g.33284  ORF Transcript_18236/g.33284 Transcript_18236/m.33284 type:complete len:483 (+) Transcript_18236:92-1540(+)